MHVKTFSSKEDFIQASTDFIIESIQKSEDENFTLALAGGNTPKPIFSKLGDELKRVPKTIQVYQIDERYIDDQDPRSNQKMIRESLLKNSPENIFFHSFDTNLPIKESVQDYEKTLSIINLQSSIFNLSVLGIGPDGHIASLFPHSEALDENQKNALHTTTDQFDIHDRLTLTYPIILNSKQILVLLKGKDKQQIIDKLLSLNLPTTDYRLPTTIDFHDFPALRLNEHPNCVIHFCET